MNHTYEHACQPDYSSDCIRIVLDMSIMVSHLCCHHVTFHVVHISGKEAPAKYCSEFCIYTLGFQIFADRSRPRAMQQFTKCLEQLTALCKLNKLSLVATLALQGSYRMLVVDAISFHSTFFN